MEAGHDPAMAGPRDPEMPHAEWDDIHDIDYEDVDHVQQTFNDPMCDMDKYCQDNHLGDWWFPMENLPGGGYCQEYTTGTCGGYEWPFSQKACNPHPDEYGIAYECKGEDHHHIEDPAAMSLSSAVSIAAEGQCQQCCVP